MNIPTIGRAAPGNCRPGQADAGRPARPILGPCPCQGCGAPVALARYRYHAKEVVAWRDGDGRPHRCGEERA